MVNSCQPATGGCSTFSDWLSAAEPDGVRFASVVGNTSGSGWYRAFRSELLAAQHPPDPATSSLADRQGGEGLGK